MRAVYEPKGPAREYAELALNHYLFCAHGCTYCYARKVMRKSPDQWGDYHEKKNVLSDTMHDCKLLSGDSRNVLLCFMSDPYQPCEEETGLTRKILKVMVSHNVKPTILTKGGLRAVRDFDILSGIQGAEFAVTLTTDSAEESLQWEPGAALPEERIESLQLAHEAGIRTWVSFEPVINPESVLRMIEGTHDFVDFYKVGKLNHDRRARDTDWPEFRAAVIHKLELLNCEYLIKDALKEEI